MFTTRSVGNLAVSAYCALAVMFISFAGGEASAQVVTPTVSQLPLSVGGDAPGNLVLTPSVEFPTVDSTANLGAYDANRAYTGYFDPDKCYTYVYAANEPDRHFSPASVATSHACPGVQWSGNYLNWAATQTIDPFRKALTGGLRVKDTVTETWLEKARSDNNSSANYFPNRTVSGSTLIGNAAPAGAWSALNTRISRLGNRMHFTGTGVLGSEGATPSGGGTQTFNGAVAYDPAVHATLNAGTVYEVSVRVKVCVLPSSLLEDNCVQYGSNYKPEGLIQKHSERLRFSAFGYLNTDDNGPLVDGGVMRARQKFVGPNMLEFDPTLGWLPTTNPNSEWDNETGQLFDNPDPADATATNAVVGGSGNTEIRYSGVINYINKFGQMTTLRHKSHDPVSELYYTATRYLRNLGNVPEYSVLSGSSALARYNLADGFPVITDWDDPIQYACQNNAILGIGDVYTHRDKNLPGNVASTAGEPATLPSAVADDDTVNVATALAKVAELEGITIATPFPVTAGNGSAYIAGLAYDIHTKDFREDVDGKQTASTYWVDVRENQTLEPRTRNQYWLAAKYGGFRVPEGFDPYAATTTSLPGASWQSGEYLTTGTTYPRPDNFYVASEADKMVDSLGRAFSRIISEGKGSASSLASNSTRLETDTLTFQAQFRSGVWSGELNAYRVLANGSLSAAPEWAAGQLLQLRPWDNAVTGGRNILVNASGSLAQFTYANTTAAQRTALGANLTEQTRVVNYLRGDRSAETTGTLRVRAGVLGDIVNSTPVFIGAPNARLHSGGSYDGASAYASYVTSTATRTPTVYVGANDGMLHAFRVTDGRELFAFVPDAAIRNGLRQYAQLEYQHKYFVDGEITAADIWDSRNGGNWKTVLVGTLGRGGPGIFALDVTNPASPTLLWEKSGTDIPQLGKNIGRPVIAQVANGDWRVLLGNGPDSTGGAAQLISIRLGGTTNGDVTTYSPDASVGNGLTAVLVRDADLDGFADTAYAGDLLGNLWKLGGLSGTTAAATSQLKLFEARDPLNQPQPITAAPMAGRDPATGATWVFFGTGKYLHELDITDKQVQTWYGLKDTNTFITGRAQLVEREILLEAPVAGATGLMTRAVSEGNAAEVALKQGWFMDLVSPGDEGERGERMIVQNQFQGSALIGTTRIPEQRDPCKPTGSGFVMAINPFTGGRLSLSFFDLNGDGVFDNDDQVCDGAGNCYPNSAIGFDSSANRPIFIEDVMQVGLDDGTTRTVRTQGSAVQAARLSWRELFND